MTLHFKVDPKFNQVILSLLEYYQNGQEYLYPYVRPYHLPATLYL